MAADHPGSLGRGWIALDWGTSRLRAWLVAQDGGVLAEAVSEDGMGRLPSGGFEAALLALVGPWLGDGPADIYACGMVGARQGWAEAAYRPVPCPPVGPPLTRAPAADPRLHLRIVPGLSQRRPRPDVMRGEETQIAGLLAARPGFDGALCLPGTHSKWAAVSAGEVTGFQTAMTGELFALLSGRSVLRHSLGGPETGGDPQAFDEAVSDMLSRPESLAARLFGLRAADLLEATPAATLRARLSGLLIGAELAAARPWWLGREVVLVGEGRLSALYARALAAQGVAAGIEDAPGLVLKGLAEARRMEAR